MGVDLQNETAEVLSRLIRFRTVNPPGNERDAMEWLARYLSDAGLECELAGALPERPNLVARLRGEASGPVLGYLGHMDTVLAEPANWTHDPWGGEVHDGFLWGRGAVDMKSQVAAEAVAAAHLARSGWRPPRGELKVITVVDEEVGGQLGAKWLTEQRPDLARCDMLVNEGASGVIRLGERRLYSVCCSEKGTFRFRVVAEGAAGHASVPGVADNALPKLAPVLTRLSHPQLGFDLTDESRGLLSVFGEDPDDPAGALARVQETDPWLAAIVRATMQVTVAPTRLLASDKINVIPARAELQVDCRAPAGMSEEDVLRRIHEAIGPHDGLRVELIEAVVGNRSPVESSLMGAIREWVAEEDDGADVFPAMMPAFTDSRWWRVAFPECVAYGFFPMRHMSLWEFWPLLHGADERIDVRDLGFAASFFADLPHKLLA